MTAPLILHYAPDNASLCVRLALEARGLAYETRLVDRSLRAQDSPAYRRLNPNGLIPTLETPDGPVFETAAILLWLDEVHGALLPQKGTPERAKALSWLFWLSNSLHPTLRMIFYPEKYIGADGIPALTEATRLRIATLLDLIEAEAAARPDWLGGAQVSALDCYLSPMLRWLALYPAGTTGWFALDRWPALFALAERMEARPCTLAAARAEGLGPRPYTDPAPAQPPEGSPT
jgi:glutathione S-transferase